MMMMMMMTKKWWWRCCWWWWWWRQQADHNHDATADYCHYYGYSTMWLLTMHIIYSDAYHDSWSMYVCVSPCAVVCGVFLYHNLTASFSSVSHHLQIKTSQENLPYHFAAMFLPTSNAGCRSRCNCWHGPRSNICALELKAGTCFKWDHCPKCVGFHLSPKCVSHYGSVLGGLHQAAHPTADWRFQASTSLEMLADKGWCVAREGVPSCCIMTFLIHPQINAWMTVVQRSGAYDWGGSTSCKIWHPLGKRAPWV